ncbi:hypothetical protein UFOVP783_35 [uncultured Caudovirales phage]|uniref:Uncharacterized protein n=1 Tax=uncultured Caudovirales phage TaxID=2100421 RepID=A0A6J5NZ36_9CAUD|nr:hypothetical protein UFOVP783_35 [uncultured Caudovirales phage]
MKPNYYVISKGRAANVAPMVDAFKGKELVWVVPPSEAEAYCTAGAQAVMSVLGLSAARNAAIAHAAERGRWAVQFDDDLVKAARLLPSGKCEPITLNAAADLLVERAASFEGVSLFGVAPTPNPFYGSLKPKRNVFVVSSFSLYKGGASRFNTKLPLKEDYDFTARVFSSGEGVMRFDDILVTIRHYTNAGGAVADRNDALEQQSIAILKSKWGTWIRDNPRRKNEILLRLPKP